MACCELAGEDFLKRNRTEGLPFSLRYLDLSASIVVRVSTHSLVDDTISVNKSFSFFMKKREMPITLKPVVMVVCSLRGYYGNSSTKWTQMSTKADYLKVVRTMIEPERERQDYWKTHRKSGYNWR